MFLINIFPKSHCNGFLFHVVGVGSADITILYTRTDITEILYTTNTQRITLAQASAISQAAADFISDPFTSRICACILISPKFCLCALASLQKFVHALSLLCRNSYMRSRSDVEIRSRGPFSNVRACFS